MKRSPLRARPPVDYSDEPGYRAWKTPTDGRCANCGARGLLLRHHVFALEYVKREGGPLFDLRNALQLGYYACACHRLHTSALKRLPRRIIPPEAIQFGVELLGEARAQAYVERYYR